MKKLNLLLATTAILSTTAWMVNAAIDDPLSSSIDIRITIFDPAMIKAGQILFPNISTVGGRVVTLSPEGEIVTSGDHATNAQTLGSYRVDPIMISGNDVGDLYNGNGNHINELIANVTIDDSSVTLTYTPVGTSESQPCGVVEHFTMGTPTFGKGYMTADGPEVRVLKIPYGATFTMNQGFIPADGRANCRGSATVTYIPYNF